MLSTTNFILPHFSKQGSRRYRCNNKRSIKMQFLVTYISWGFPEHFEHFKYSYFSQQPCEITWSTYRRDWGIGMLSSLCKVGGQRVKMGSNACMNYTPNSSTFTKMRVRQAFQLLFLWHFSGQNTSLPSLPPSYCWVFYSLSPLGLDFNV
jgi:hypothetical protein